MRRAFHEARCALEATSLAEDSHPDVASHRDLGAFTLLLALQDDDALRLYSDGLLEPIERTEGEYGGELLRPSRDLGNLAAREVERCVDVARGEIDRLHLRQRCQQLRVGDRA